MPITVWRGETASGMASSFSNGKTQEDDSMNDTKDMLLGKCR